MSEPIRRRRRRRISDSSDRDFDLISRTKSSPSIDTQTSEDNTPSNVPQVTIDREATRQMVIDRIRSEIIEDEYHCLFDEPDFSDDSHNWGDNLESTSSDYWHFLGRFE